jgi:predicted TIM-barrel fold metal-dependent hydrolase
VQALEHLLVDGWQIEPPVIGRISWTPRESGELDYHFIIVRRAQRSLVVLPGSDELRAFCAALDLTVALPAAEASRPSRRLTLKAPSHSS